MATLRLCSIPDCGKPVYARGWCERHYTRWRRYGSPLAGSTFEGAPLQFLQDALQTESLDCLDWPFGKNPKGYAKFHADGKTVSVSRLICEAVHGKAPSPNHEAAHSCGRGHMGCINPQHLKWKTHAENIADKRQHGTHQEGEKHGMARLNEDAVRAIRHLRGLMTQEEIGRAFSVTNSSVSKIQKRQTWTCVD